MWDWITGNWGGLLTGLILAGYFAFYVTAIRHQRQPDSERKFKLPCDRC